VNVELSDLRLGQAWKPHRASGVSSKALPPTADDLKVARLQGRRVAIVAKALKAAAAADTAA
jgi:hypothetical protein